MVLMSASALHLQVNRQCPSMCNSCDVTSLCSVLCREVVDYLANTLIFVLSGIIIAGRVYDGHQAGSPYILTGMDYGWAVALWLLLLVSHTLTAARHLAVGLAVCLYSC